ncbi:MAG: hypothetical protein K2P94_00815 [Rhodospirillaceae bacterium]|nr:hypothetical protein [Rhodospirillaceae bacterium]
MAKSCGIGDRAYYHGILVHVVAVSGGKVTVESFENKTRRGVDLGRPWRWVLTPDELEEGDDD